jgi:hypothetical protein
MEQVELDLPGGKRDSGWQTTAHWRITNRSTQQALEAQGTAGSQQHKDRHQGGGSHPHPTLLGHLTPAGLIHIGIRLLTDIILRFLNRLGQGRTDLLFLSGHTPQAQFSLEDHAHQLLHIPVTDAKPPPQVADQGLGARAKAARGHLGRPLPTGLSPTTQAGQPTGDGAGHDPGLLR